MGRGRIVPILRQLLRRGLTATLGALKWLVLPLALLLFLQWPLRELVHGYSREANDLGQWLFALYVAGSVTAATLAGTHLAADAIARRYSARTRRLLLRFGQLVAIAPWAIFVSISAWPLISSSLQHWEGFPDTGNPGYFIVKLALWLLTAGMLAAILIDVPADRDEERRP
jgi:TRAP-type mannitol/chloroaromatic compound transport system permease small subunit